MSNKPFFSILLILFFSFLTACGGSDSKSSGDKPQNKTETKTEEKTETEEKTKACVVGKNPLKQGESCIHKNTKYTCNSGKVSGGPFSSGGNLVFNDVTISCD